MLFGHRNQSSLESVLVNMVANVIGGFHFGTASTDSGEPELPALRPIDEDEHETVIDEVEPAILGDGDAPIAEQIEDAQNDDEDDPNFRETFKPIKAKATEKDDPETIQAIMIQQVRLYFLQLILFLSTSFTVFFKGSTSAAAIHDEDIENWRTVVAYTCRGRYH